GLQLEQFDLELALLLLVDAARDLRVVRVALPPRRVRAVVDGPPAILPSLPSQLGDLVDLGGDVDLARGGELELAGGGFLCHADSFVPGSRARTPAGSDRFVSGPSLFHPGVAQYPSKGRGSRAQRTRRAIASEA